ncbi:hypothetical protein VSK91_05345 [Bacillus swezeyi]|uniref:hypothetical protein n=1 Tax=Bacillus swezeyi TaxID=1925020 RepID=UPI0039C72B35
MTDTDGQPGGEVIVIAGNKIMIINDRSHSSKEHAVPSGNEGFSNLVEATDTNGKDGAELIVTVEYQLYIFSDTSKDLKTMMSRTFPGPFRMLKIRMGNQE